MTTTLRCQKKKKKILFFKTKTVTKQGLIVLRWILPESFPCCFFNKTVAGLQKRACIPPCLPRWQLSSDVQAQQELRFYRITPPRHMTAQSGLLLSPQIYTFDCRFSPFRRETSLLSIILWLFDVCEGAFMLVCDCWFSCFLFPPLTLWLHSLSVPYVLWRWVGWGWWGCYSPAR